MGREKLMRKYGCKVIKNLNDDMTPEDIRKAIEKGDITADENHKKCESSCPWTYGCEVLKNLNDAMTPKDIREEIEDGTIEAKDHAKCPFSCPWGPRNYIETLSDPTFFIQDIVKEGEMKLAEKKSQEKDTEAIKAKAAVPRFEFQDDSPSPGSPAGSSSRSPSNKEQKRVKAVKYEVK